MCQAFPLSAFLVLSFLGDHVTHQGSSRSVSLQGLVLGLSLRLSLGFSFGLVWGLVQWKVQFRF